MNTGTEPAMQNVLPFTATRPITSVVHVDPATAAQWLSCNTNNRPIRRNVLASYVRDMKAGQWQLTGEAIKFAFDGSLLDGQHRLEAVVRSGQTVQMFVISGLDPHTRDVMDTGAKRTTADVLKMEGQHHSVPLAAGGRVAIRFERGNADDHAPGIISNPEVLAWIAQNPLIHGAVDLARKHLKDIPVPTGVLVYGAWRLMCIDEPAARDFFYQVAELDNIPANDPRKTLYKRLRTMKGNKTVDTPAGYLDLFFQAWNRWRDGKSATLFRVNRTRAGRVILTEPR